MPEYSSTTITPADAVKTPAMNGSTSGNFTLSALRDYILASKGQANGLASLDANGKLPTSQLPDLADDVLVYASLGTFPATGTAGKIYIAADTNLMYRWDADLATPDYVELSSDLSDYATIADLLDGTIEPLISTKAKQDQNGNVINTTYATKTEMQTADSELKGAIDANSKRITNLETKAGDEIPVTYPSATYGMDGVPASVAPYTKVRELIMNSRVRNQLFNKYNYDSSTTVNGVTFTNNGDGSITVSGTATGGDASFSLGFIILRDGKKYVLSGCPSGGAASSYSLANNYTTMLQDTGSGALGGVTGLDRNVRFMILVIEGTSIITPKTFRPSLTDETLYFGGTIPTNAQTIAQIQQNYPELLIPSDYDTGTRVDTTYSGVKSEGKNLCEVSSFVNTNIGGSGEEVDYLPSASSSDYIPVRANSSLTFSANTSILGLRIAEYDANKTFIIRDAVVNQASVTATLTGNTRYVRWCINYEDNTTVTEAILNNIQLQLEYGSARTTFSAYKSPVTLSLPTPVTGKSAGAVHQIYYPDTGEITEPIGEQDLSQIAFSYNSTFASWLSNSAFTLAKAPASNDDVPNIQLTGYVSIKGNDVASTAVMTISMNIGGDIWVNNGSSSTPPSGTMMYELATPNPNSQATEPMPDPFIKVEGNGTIRPVQSQTTQIDSAMSVDYLGV